MYTDYLLWSIAVADDWFTATDLPLESDNRVSIGGSATSRAAEGTGAEGGGGFRGSDSAEIGLFDGVPADVEANPGLIPALNGVVNGLCCPDAPGVPIRREVIPRKRC